MCTCGHVLVPVSVHLLPSVAGQFLYVRVYQGRRPHLVFLCSHVCPYVPSCPLSFSGPTSSQAFLPHPNLRTPSFLRSPGDFWTVLGVPQLYPSTFALHPSCLSLLSLPPASLSTPPLSLVLCLQPEASLARLSAPPSGPPTGTQRNQHQRPPPPPAHYELELPTPPSSTAGPSTLPWVLIQPSVVLTCASPGFLLVPVIWLRKKSWCVPSLPDH